MVKSLDKKWKEFLFSFSAFGPNFMMVLMGAYFTDAINPAALPDESLQAIMGGTCFILPAIFPILYAISKAFDGIIDIPFAYISDTLSTKWGRRRPTIAVCAVPMILSFVMCWIPVGGPENQLLNTIWIIVWALIFFSTYTMCLISFYGSVSTTCSDEPQRMRVSSYKSFFDTISYCLVYALVPLLLEVMDLHIHQFVYCTLPIMVTIFIPLFLIKEGEKYGYPEREGQVPEKIGVLASLAVTYKNPLFRSWLLVHGCTTVGLQMFLVGMNAMIVGGMGFNGGEMALVNTAAFAPVPIMLYLFNKVKQKKGIRFTFQTCLLAFGVAILSFFFASTFITGGNKPVQYAIAITAGVVGSWGIGAFFMMPILVPSQIASVEEKVTGKNRAAMYFAGNAVISSVLGALSSSLIYENIKMLFIDKATFQVTWAENVEAAAAAMGAAGDTVYNLGTLMVPFVVFVSCVAGVFACLTMPKDYTVANIARIMKKHDPSLDIDHLLQTDAAKESDEKGEVIFVQVGLEILSGFLYGFIWAAFLLRSVKEFLGKKALPAWLLCCLVPFAGGFVMAKRNAQLVALGKEKGVSLKSHKVLHIVCGLVLPVLPVNVISLALTQHNLNKLYKAECGHE